MRRTTQVIAATAAVAISAALVVTSATAATPTNTSALRGAVTVGGIMDHEAAFQAIADANGGTRASGTPGYEASVGYVSGKLQDAGYAVSLQPFSYDRFVENADATFSQTTPDAQTYTLNEDFLTMEYSGSGGVAAALLVPTNDIVIPPGAVASTSNSGCEATDFVAASPTEDQVALIQRGTCTFADKAVNAEAAGYDAVVIFNEGQDGRQETLSGTLGADSSIGIPVIGTSYAIGEALYGVAAHVSITTDTSVVTTTTRNVLAETKGGRSDRTVVVGAHLDSVPEGPGINDNGSGSATNLEVALQMAKIQPTNKVRFAFWGAEESGLIGSEYYVSQLSARDRKNIALNLNFDMVGSPNYARFVYDGDGSGTGTSGPNGSGVVEDVFTDYFDSLGLASEPTAFDGRSDYGPFIAVGIPAGGLFTGAEEIKTAAQAALYGGTAGVAFDPCYHQACDTIANVNTTAIDEMSDAVAHATLTFAMTTSAVGGTAKGNRTPVPTDSLLFKGSHLQK